MGNPATTIVSNQVLCYHCGDPCRNETINAHDKPFCCEGCKLVYEILEENQLGNYYKLNTAPGDKAIKQRQKDGYEFLEDAAVLSKLVTFQDYKETHITFHLPQIHCSSCIWLLEHLYRLDPGVKRSTVNFLKREVHIIFSNQETSLRKVAELLSRIGYPPHISLEQLETKPATAGNTKQYYKMGVAFFAFGNIMLFSFPEYFGLDDVFDAGFAKWFGWLNLLLSLPVFLYADTDFFRSAWTGLKSRNLNMDFPISLGILVMYFRSVYEILSGTGPGYMDTFSGLVFFMLAGRMFQNKTYDRLSFERDYKSYFPIAVTAKREGKEVSVAVAGLQSGDRIVVRNGELIPADGLLLKGSAAIDYSFVTGESIPVTVATGNKIYAGGRQTSGAIEIELTANVSQSRLTQLWNEFGANAEKKKNHVSIVNMVSTWFTVVVLMIATGAAIYWMALSNMQNALNAFTSVLIITCPCALALSYPFALGNSIRILGRKKIYLKNTGVIETLSHIDTIVFDKTGTMTHAAENKVSWFGDTISIDETQAVVSLLQMSNHPLSRFIATSYPDVVIKNVTGFASVTGKGISGTVNNRAILAGKPDFVGFSSHATPLPENSEVYISINGQYKGKFEIVNSYRNELQETLSELSKNYDLYAISGDNAGERNRLEQYFVSGDHILFNQHPEQKLAFIKQLQEQKKKVMMVGDGLNDAGALFQSDAGIVIAEDTNNFSPACDAIMHAGAFGRLGSLLRFSKISMRVIFISYIISLLYNSIGISYAVSAGLSPLIAAVIMPLSTITIVVFTTAATNLAAKWVWPVVERSEI